MKGANQRGRASSPRTATIMSERRDTNKGRRCQRSPEAAARGAPSGGGGVGSRRKDFRVTSLFGNTQPHAESELNSPSLCAADERNKRNHQTTAAARRHNHARLKPNSTEKQCRSATNSASVKTFLLLLSSAVLCCGGSFCADSKDQNSKLNIKADGRRLALVEGNSKALKHFSF